MESKALSSPAYAGDLEAVQGQAQSAAGASSTQLALATLTGQDARSTDTDRAHLEANMASAVTLQSPQEYQRWLLTYVQYLTRCKSCPPPLETNCRVSPEQESCCDNVLHWSSDLGLCELVARDGACISLPKLDQALLCICAD